MLFKKVFSTENPINFSEKEKLLLNKKYPEKYHLQIATVLRFFPELKEIPIRFEEHKQWFPLLSRPDLKTLLFYPSGKREYLISFSTESKGFPKELLFHNLPFNAQVGILGHELSHTVFYLSQSGRQLFSIGLKYLFSDYRVKFEKDTDKETIKRGLGKQLLDFARYCRNHPKTSDKILLWLNTYYMKPEEIIDHMNTGKW